MTSASHHPLSHQPCCLWSARWTPGSPGTPKWPRTNARSQSASPTQGLEVLVQLDAKEEHQCACSIVWWQAPIAFDGSIQAKLEDQQNLVSQKTHEGRELQSHDLPCQSSQLDHRQLSRSSHDHAWSLRSWAATAHGSEGFSPKVVMPAVAPAASSDARPGVCCASFLASAGVSLPLPADASPYHEVPQGRGYQDHDHDRHSRLSQSHSLRLHWPPGFTGADCSRAPGGWEVSAASGCPPSSRKSCNVPVPMAPSLAMAPLPTDKLTGSNGQLRKPRTFSSHRGLRCKTPWATTSGGK